MSIFDLERSLREAEARLGSRGSSRRPRSDRGKQRLHPELERVLTARLAGFERVSVGELRSGLAELCRSIGRPVPSRGTIYEFMRRAPGASYAVGTLPERVRAALYNVAPDASVPAHQLAFYCFNYGDLAAASFAAGLPWLALYQAAKLRGWRPKSRGLLQAVLAARGIA